MKDHSYKDKVIINPMAVPDPEGAQGNYSWMYLMAPYYNELVKEFEQNQNENYALKQHFEYFIEMEEEKMLLNQEFELLKQAEANLVGSINNTN